MVWFDTNGWKRDKDRLTSFNKGNQIVSISYSGEKILNYTIICFEKTLGLTK